MLGANLHDPDTVEGGGSMRGMELLPIETTFASRKIRNQVTGVARVAEGFFSCLAGLEFEGYEIHMGVSVSADSVRPFAALHRDGTESADGVAIGNVLGSYVHGLFDSGSIADRLAEKLLGDRGMAYNLQALPDHRQYKEQQYDRLAEAMRGALNMKAIYNIAGL